MKKIFITLFALLVASTSFAEGALKYGVAPSNPNSPDSLKVFLGYLSERTGQKFELVEIDYDQLLQKIADGEISFADLTSSAFATANSLYKDKIRYVATVAARNQKGDLVPYYKGVFFVKADSPYGSMFDLKGKSFAFVAKSSTSGYVYPVSTLNSMGIDPDTYFSSITFAGNHDKIFEGLKNGFLDGGVSNYDAWAKAKTTYGDIFRVIGETAEIPSGAIVASSKVDSGTIKKVQEALISIKPTDPVVNYPGFLYKGFVKKGGGFYEFLKNLLKR